MNNIVWFPWNLMDFNEIFIFALYFKFQHFFSCMDRKQELLLISNIYIYIFIDECNNAIKL